MSQSQEALESLKLRTFVPHPKGMFNYSCSLFCSLSFLKFPVSSAPTRCLLPLYSAKASCGQLWPMCSPAYAIRLAVSQLPPGRLLARELSFSLMLLATCWPWCILCCCAYWQSPQLLSGARGGDRGTPMSNLIPRACCKEPTSLWQRLASCYIDFYINNKRQASPPASEAIKRI